MALYKITELPFGGKESVTQYEALPYHTALAKFKEWCEYRNADLDREDDDEEIQEGEELTAYYEGLHWIKLEAE